MLLHEFNALDESAAAEVLLSCAAVPQWADDIAGQRPFAALTTLLAYAERRALDWTGEQVTRALADHPRIGEKHPGHGAGAAHSAREQAGVDPADDEVQRALAVGNRRYEEIFDRIFLVRAAGRDAHEILALLEQRLTNDPVTELEVTAGQLRAIAALRLAGLVT